VFFKKGNILATKNQEFTQTKYAGNYAKLSVYRVAILGVLLSLMIALKYFFGFLPGIEFITFSFAFIGLFLPLLDLFVLLSSFILLVMAMYGFGT
jgi:hypothetical protein